MTVTVDLQALDGEYAVTLLPADQTVPDWVRGPGFVNVSYCSDELSIVTQADRVPDGVETDKGWRTLKLTSMFSFDQPGIVLSVVRPISEAGLAVFVISTFHRDYLLVRSRDFDRARELLGAAGHTFSA
jgi:uncharacterized protein